MLLAPIAIRALVHQLAGDQGTVAFDSAIDARLLFANFAIALLVSIFFSLAPALQLRRLDINLTMGQKSSTGTSAHAQFPPRRGLPADRHQRASADRRGPVRAHDAESA